MSVKDFRSNSLSDKIVYSLIEATQAYSSMDVLLNEYPAIKPVLHDMLLSFDIYYDRYDTHPDIADIYFGLFIPNQMIESGKNATVIRACLECAQNKIKMTDVLTAGDILKIDRAIKNVNIEHLAIDGPSQNQRQTCQSVLSKCRIQLLMC